MSDDICDITHAKLPRQQGQAVVTTRSVESRTVSVDGRPVQQTDIATTMKTDTTRYTFVPRELFLFSPEDGAMKFSFRATMKFRANLPSESTIHGAFRTSSRHFAAAHELGLQLLKRSVSENKGVKFASEENSRIVRATLKRVDSKFPYPVGINIQPKANGPTSSPTFFGGTTVDLTQRDCLYGNEGMYMLILDPYHKERDRVLFDFSEAYNTSVNLSMLCQIKTEAEIGFDAYNKANENKIKMDRRAFGWKSLGVCGDASIMSEWERLERTQDPGDVTMKVPSFWSLKAEGEVNKILAERTICTTAKRGLSFNMTRLSSDGISRSGVKPVFTSTDDLTEKEKASFDPSQKEDWVTLTIEYDMVCPVVTDNIFETPKGKAHRAFYLREEEK